MVYTKTVETEKDNLEVGRQLCETYMVLGEVSLENENYPQVRSLRIELFARYGAAAVADCFNVFTDQAVEDLELCLARRVASLPSDSRCIAETHYQLGVAQAHCTEYANAEKSLAAAVAVLNTRIANLRKMETSENITKELADLTLLCTEIKERMSDHKEMQKGTYKEDKDFVSIFKGMLVLIKQLLLHF